MDDAMLERRLAQIDTDSSLAKEQAGLVFSLAKQHQATLEKYISMKGFDGHPEVDAVWAKNYAFYNLVENTISNIYGHFISSAFGFRRFQFDEEFVLRDPKVFDVKPKSYLPILDEDYLKCGVELGWLAWENLGLPKGPQRVAGQVKNPTFLDTVKETFREIINKPVMAVTDEQKIAAGFQESYKLNLTKTGQEVLNAYRATLPTHE